MELALTGPIALETNKTLTSCWSGFFLLYQFCLWLHYTAKVLLYLIVFLFLLAVHCLLLWLSLVPQIFRLSEAVKCLKSILGIKPIKDNDSFLQLAFLYVAV